MKAVTRTLTLVVAGVMMSGAALTGTAVLAAEHGAGHGAGQGMAKKSGWVGHMMRADTDGDGAISRAEADARHAERFETMDRNGDGSITEQEIRDALRLRMFRYMDSDGDRSVSEDEFLEHHEKFGGRMMGGMHHGGKHHGDGMHGGGMHGGGMHGGGMHGGVMKDDAERHMDRGDIESMMNERFGRMDLDGDGQINREEMREMLKRRDGGGYHGGAQGE